VKRKNCFICSSDLPAGRTRFCSASCSDYHDSIRRKRNSLRLSTLLAPKKCAGCGKAFKPKTERHASCSRTCWDIVVATRRKERRAELRKAGKVVKGLGTTEGSGNKARKNGHYKQIRINVSKTVVSTAKFTKADTRERMELQSKVEEYLANGGKILKYSSQPAVISEDNIPKWEITEVEEEIAVEKYRELNANNGY
jgi:predicted nucleic acid-binding Zn ribbon protein